MVLSVDIPLKKSEQDVVDFLLHLVFTSEKKRATLGGRQKLLHHDVRGASDLIKWILNKSISGSKNAYSGQQKTWRVVCNLMYGNAIVLRQQVSRLLHDALRAREIVAFSTVLAQEEERKKRMLALMQKTNDEYMTPKKKRKADELQMDEFLMAPPTPISTALKQNITMPDVFGIRNEEIPFCGDDLEPVDPQQMEMLFGMLEGSDQPPSSTLMDRTFIDRFSEDKNCATNIDMDLNLDFDLARPNDDFIQEQMTTPKKHRNLPLPAIEEEFFEPSAGLRDLLLYGRLPLTETRKTMEDEMEEARHLGISNDSQIEGQQSLTVPRLVSEQLELDTNVTIPPSASKTPRGSAVKKDMNKSPLESEAINHKVPHKEMARLMEDFSSLVHKDVSVLQAKKFDENTLSFLMNPVPIYMRKSNERFWELFPRGVKKYDKNIVHVESEEEEEEEEELPEKRPRPDDLEPIELSQLQAPATPRTPVSPLLQNPEFEPLEEPRQQSQEVGEFIQPHSFSPLDQTLRFDAFKDIDNRVGDVECTSSAAIRENIISECHKSSPFPVKLDSLLTEKASRREAARTFYAALELLKERVLEVHQSAPFAKIELTLSGSDSFNLDDVLEEGD